MGGQKGGDRKSYKATSSAKAAEALAAKGGGGGGFGGFSGTRPVAGFGFGAPAAAAASPAVTSSTSTAAGDPLELSAQLDGELAQCLRHLSKRDTTTKMKALQNLEELISQKTPADLTIMLQPWIYHFKRLLLDPSKSVRMKATVVMAAVATAVGKALAPQLKALLGPWFVASFDPYPDAAAAAKKSLGDVFPGRKQLDALIFCRSEVLAHIASSLTATPASLGDPQRDTKEELEERHERILTASLAAAAALLTTVTQVAAAQAQPGTSSSSGADAAGAPGAAAAAALQDVQEKVSEIMAVPGFFKQKLGSKSPVVARAAYGFVQAVCSSALQLMKPCLSTAAPAVLAALQDKDPSNHPAMWEMLLAFVSSQKPDCWATVNLQKAVVPRLLSLLRHGCYGSAVTSLPALLPFLAQLPRSAFTLQPLLLLDQVLESIWIGQQQLGAAARGDRAVAAAVAAAYQECLCWGLRNAAALSTAATAGGEPAAAGSSAEDSGSSAAVAYCSQLLSAGHFSSLLQLAVSSTTADAQLAADIVQDVLLQLCNAPSTAAAATAAAAGSSSSDQLPLQLAALAAAVGGVIQEVLSSSCHHQPPTAEQEAAVSSEAAASTVCLRVQQLLDALSDSSSKHSQAVARQLGSYCCAALLPVVQAGQQLPAPAANLLARLIREHPDAAQLPASNAAAAGAGSAGAVCTAGAAIGAGSGSSSSSIAALVKLGVGSCEAGGELASADAELLLSCVAGSSDAAVGWGLLLAELSSLGHTAAAWRFLDSLLRQAASSSQGPFTAAGSRTWCHSMLDDYVDQLLQQLQQQEVPAGAGSEGKGSQHASGDGSSSSSRGLSRQQAAAASLLGCCLGANKQQVVLLGPAALTGVMESMQSSLAAALEQQQQQQHAPDAAAAPFIAALLIMTDSSTHVPSSVTGSPSSIGLHGRASSSRSLWQQQPDSLAAVLLLVWQLGWSAGPDGTQGWLAALEFDASSSSGSSDAGSDAGSGSESSMSDSSSEGEEAAAGREHDEAVAAAEAAGVGAQDSSSTCTAAAAAWRALHAAALRLWTPEVISMALTELPDAAAGRLMHQLEQLLLSAVQEAAAAASAGAASAAVSIGTQLAVRAAVVLEGLQGHSDEQQKLLQQLLGAVQGWQRWGAHHSSTGAHSSSGNGADSSSSSGGSGGVDVWSSPEYVLMLQFSCVLVLQAGCDVVLPLHHGHLLSRAAGGSDGASSSSDASGRDHERLWLRLELLCADTSLRQPAAAPGGLAAPGSRTPGAEAEALLRCTAAAAAAAERQLVKAAGKGSSGAASAVARSQLGSALGQLLSAALAACTPQPASDGDSSSAAIAQVYCQTLQQLLSRAVAAVAASAAARMHLQPVLEQLMKQHVTTAVLECASRASTATNEAGSAPGVAAAATLLAPVLQECAQAFRFAASNDAALTSSGFAELSVQLMHKATAAETVVPLPLLQLAVACFPIQLRHEQHHSKQGEQAHAAVCTAAERKGLAALLRHVCSSATGTTSTATTTAGSADASAGAAAASAQLQCQLQLCCVSYCWSDMMAAEWHIVLRDAQQRLTAARREVEKAAGGLAGAVCTAAQELLGGRSDAEVMSPAMAIQLLRRLEQKGLLQKTPAVADALRSAADAAVQQLSQLWVLQLALEVLASVLQLQDRVQAAGRAPQLGLALEAAWRELLSLFLALGAAVAVVSCCGGACSDVLLQYCQERGGTWLLLQQCLVGCSEAGGEAVGKVLAAANDKAELLGVDAVGCCLALLQQGGFHHRHHHQGSVQQQQHQHQQGSLQQQGRAPLQELAWELLLHPTNLAAITHAAAASDGSEGEAEGIPEYGVSDDAAAYLVKVGLRPEMAAGLAASRPWQLHMLLWALLLAHMGSLRARSTGQQRLCQALREVPELVPEVLDRVAGLMGLGGSSKGSQAAAAAAGEVGEVPAATGALSSAAQASLSASLQAAGTAGSKAVSTLSGGTVAAAGSIWSVAAALRSIGLPQSHSSWRLLAAGVYRAVLCTLPASARLWFSDLRDRSRSTAVENYTSRYESPALLAAEFAAIKRDAAGSSGEVGGSCSFRVVANAASREVTAVLEIEDGATLELVVKLPASAPLKAPEVDCKNKVGIKDGRLRKWLLSIAVFLRNQNQGVLDGITMWKANLEQEFAGVEACLICYSVISAANGQLPRISCKQCSVKFHPACLYKWFRSSGKSTCPHCSALF